MSTTLIPLSAAVLTGGRSRRMGTDKALVELAGRPLVEHAIQAVATISDDVFLVGARDSYSRFHVRVVDDDYPGTGPLGGIATALRHARHDRVLVVACDMPSLSPSLLAAMAGLSDDVDAMVPATAASRSRQGSTQTYETLHAIYRRSCLDAIERSLAAGQFKVAGFLGDVRVRVLNEEWLREYDPSLASFANANTPLELAGLTDVMQENAE